MAERDVETPPLLRTLTEAIASQMGMGRGRWRLELVFEQGRLRECFRHEERIPADQLEERFAGAEGGAG